MVKVYDVNWNDPKFIRAGIIPFVEQGGIRFYAFGLENGVAAIGDFGGHIEKWDNDALDAAIREYQEESLNAFGELHRENMMDYDVLIGKDTAEILVPVNGPLHQYNEIFRELLGTNPDHEVQSIIWLSKQQLLTAIDNQQTTYEGTKLFHMYFRICNAIQSNREAI